MTAQDTSSAKSAPTVGPEPPWADWPDDQLLELRLCDLKVAIEGSWLEPRIAALYGELEARDITFRPHFWLSDEWFTPDGDTGVAIPFSLQVLVREAAFEPVGLRNSDDLLYFLREVDVELAPELPPRLNILVRKRWRASKHHAGGSDVRGLRRLIEASGNRQAGTSDKLRSFTKTYKTL